MTDGQMLLLILSLLYLSDCFVWIGSKTVLFAAQWCRRWRVTFGGSGFPHTHGSIMMLNPLPPLGSNFLGHWLPISISPTGVCAFTLLTLQTTTRTFQTGTVLLYEAIKTSSAEGKYLILNGSQFAKCGNEEQAQSLAELISRILHEPEAGRAEVIRKSVAQRFALAEARRRLERTNDLATKLRWAGSLFFIFLYVITPIVCSIYQLDLLLIPVAIIMLLNAWFIAHTYSCAHQALDPKLPGRRSNVAKMILCPPVAIRAVDLLTLNAMSRFHPLLLAKLFLGSGSLALARSVIGDLKYPIQHNLTDPQALSIVTWHSNCELDACIKFLTGPGKIDRGTLLAPPAWDGLSATYCPRCFCQFGADTGDCPDCPGVALLPFIKTKKSEVSHE